GALGLSRRRGTCLACPRPVVDLWRLPRLQAQAAVLTAAPAHNHAELMDRVYRRQRYIYDFTRKYYLFGRDRLIRELALKPGARVIEVGCGTARNLIKIAQAYPQAQLFGLDASDAMLESAEVS